MKEERRNDRNTETRCEQPTTKSGRCDQRGCRVVWLLFNEPSGSFQSKRESLLSGSDHFKNKGSLLSSCVHITGLHCAWSQSSRCSPYDNNKRPAHTHIQNTHLSTNGRHLVHMNSTWIEINIRCVFESRVQCGDGFGTEGV